MNNNGKDEAKSTANVSLKGGCGGEFQVFSHFLFYETILLCVLNSKKGVISEIWGSCAAGGFQSHLFHASSYASLCARNNEKRFT
jgi:hypothetical protein